MENIIKKKIIKFNGCKRYIILIQASYWFSNYKNIIPPVYPKDIVLATYIEWDGTKISNFEIETKETIAIFRNIKDAKSFFKTYKYE
jgi:hypothetical protein